jgi:hypothetical protein
MLYGVLSNNVPDIDILGWFSHLIRRIRKDFRKSRMSISDTFVVSFYPSLWAYKIAISVRTSDR